jgi:16S rRNA (adenine1518-N6/adenine1519-N6)-dimethyltransferase
VEGNVDVYQGDILKLQPAVLLGNESTPYKVVANLPYYISSAAIRLFLEASLKPRLMVLMVQKEVAETIMAGTGRMSLLSNSVQFYSKPEIAGYAPAGCFYPTPEVDSAVLKIDVYPRPALTVNDTDSFFRLVRAGFTASRKQIANSLALGLGLPKNEVVLLLEEAGIITRRRAETLALEEWQRLWQVLKERRKC